MPTCLCRPRRNESTVVAGPSTFLRYSRANVENRKKFHRLCVKQKIPMLLQSSSALSVTKRDLRRAMKGKRAALLKDPRFLLQAANLFRHHILLPANAIVASYAAMGDELDPLPNSRCFAFAWAYYRVACRGGKKFSLIFRRYEQTDR